MTDYKSKKQKEEKHAAARDELFKKRKIHAFDEKNGKISKNIESDNLLKVHSKHQKTFHPALNAKNPKTFAYYGSAKKYYSDALYTILNYYPFDGTQEEVINWHTSSAAVDVALIQQWWPRAKGALNFNYSEYVDFYAGPQIIDKSKNRANFKDMESGLRLNPEKGNAAEFWLNKKGFNPSHPEEIIFDISSHKDNVLPQSAGQFRLILSNSSGTPTESPFKLTYTSGSTGVTNVTIGSPSAASTVVDGEWHHYAVSVFQESSKLNIKFYIDGVHNRTQKVSVPSMGIIDSYMGGALGTGYTSVTGTLSASLDDYRFWKGTRNSREIGRFYDHKIYASDTKKENYTNRLGLYYKFNEGLIGKTNKDKILIDYSGNNILGTIGNYSSTTRLSLSAIDNSNISKNIEIPDPIMHEDNPKIQIFKQELRAIGEAHDLNNQNSLTKFLPNWATDRHGNADLNMSDDFAILLHLLSIQFDEIKLGLDSIRRNTGILFEGSNHDLLNVSEYQASGSQYIDNKFLGCSVEDEADIIYPGNRIDFPLRKLMNQGLEVVSYPIISESSVEEEIDQKSEKLKFVMSPQQVSTVILENMHTACTDFMKKKGTVGVSSQILSAFGADSNIITQNIYSNNSELFLDNAKKQITTLKKNSISFVDNKESCIYLSASGDIQRSYLKADTEETEYTFEGTFVFPIKKQEKYEVTDSSIFGLHEVSANNNDLKFSDTDNASIQVSVIKSPINDNDAKFVLSSTSGMFSTVETSYIPDVYKDSQWNIALRVSKDVDNRFLESSNPGFKVELLGHNYILDYLDRSFSIVSNINNSTYNSFKNSNKTLYIGAHRTNITGSVLKSTDIKVLNFHAWNDSLSEEEIKYRSKSPSYYGRINPSFGQNKYSTNTRKMFNNRILSIEVNSLSTISNDGIVHLTDFSSGSAENRQLFGELLGSKYNFSSLQFSKKKENVLKDEYIPSVRDIPVGNILAEDGILVKDSELDKFTLSNEIETPIISYEKSLYQNISQEMIDFLSGVKALNNLIGEPADKYRQKYKSLDYVKRKFFGFVDSEIQIENYIRYYRWINKSVGEFIEQVIPASSFSNTGIENVIESHILERNKYDHKLPTLEFKDPKIEGQLLGINELLYDWEHGHAPLSNNEADNCLWWNDRATRHRDNPISNLVDANRETLRESRNTLVSGSAYVFRKLSRPWKYTVDRQQIYNVGSNSKANKIKDLYKIVNQGYDIEIKSSDIYHQKECSDIIEPTKKIKYVAKTNTSDTSGYLDADADLLLPFSLHSSSAGKDFSEFKNNLIITNNHDKTPALRGSFVSKNVGSYPHENVAIGTPKENRPEAYDIQSSANSLKITQASGPKSFVKIGPGGSPFYSVGNIKTIPGTTLGNYRDEYEIVQIHGRSQNNNYITENEKEHYSTRATVVISYTNNPGNNETLTLTSTDGTSVTFKFKSGINTLSQEASSGFYQINRGTASEDFTWGTFATAFNEGSSHRKHPLMGKMSASIDIVNNKVKLTQLSGGIRSNTNIEHALTNCTVPSSFTGGKEYESEIYGKPVESKYISGLIDYSIPSRTRRSHVITNRFSAIGSADTSGIYAKDRESEEFSIYNSVNYRNSVVREMYNHFSAERSEKFGLRPVTSLTGSLHKKYRNPQNNVNGRATKYDNLFVHHQIPRNDFGYSWISDSALCSLDQFLTNNAGVGHQHSFGISGSTATGITKSSQTITFLTASAMGLRRQSATPLLFGLEPGYLGTGTLIDDAVYIDFTGLNSVILDPISTEENTLGNTSIVATRGTGAKANYLNINYVNGALSRDWGPFNAYAQSSVKDRDVSRALVLSGIILNRQGPYGWPTWKQIRGGQHPIARAHKRNNTLSVCFRDNAAFPSCYPGSRFDYRDSVEDNEIKTKSRTIKNYNEVMVTSRFKPIIISMHPTNEESMIEFFTPGVPIPDSIPQILLQRMWYNDQHFHTFMRDELEREGANQAPSFNYRIPIQNTVTSFANENLVQDIDFKERPISETENIIKAKSLLSYQNPLFIKEVNYMETIYPREINTYTLNARKRRKFNFFGWKSGRSSRQLILTGNIDYSTSFLVSNTSNKNFLMSSVVNKEENFEKCYFNTADIIDLNSTGSKASPNSSIHITASKWSLDSRDFSTWGTPLNIQGGFMAGVHLGAHGENYLDNYRNREKQHLTSKKGMIQGIRGEGILQNDYSMWPMGYNGLRGAPPFAPVYNRRIPQMVSTNVYLAGEANFSAADNLPIGPFFNSYDEYAEETRLVGQDYSLLPEFTISKFIEDIYKSGDFEEASLRDDFLQLTGALYHSSSAMVSIGSQFFKTYSNSDFMKYFEPIKKELIDGSELDAGRLTLRCQAVKRFLPYRGFYPAERTVQITEIFNRCYMQEGSYTAEYVENSGISSEAANNFFKLRLENSKAQIAKPLFSPGVLYNSIKSGIAVDYPIFSSSVQNLFTKMESYKGKLDGPGYIGAYVSLNLGAEAGFAGSHLNNTTDTGIPRIRSKVSRRVNFDDLLNPERMFEETVYDNEPHPSASLLYGSVNHMKVLDRPATFGSFNKTETLNKTSINFNNTRQGFHFSMLPYKSAMHNFASETVSFFLKDQKVSTLLSEPVKPYLQSGVTYKMKVFLVNNDTVMYDRHSAFGPPVDEGNVQIKTYSKEEISTQPLMPPRLMLPFTTASYDLSFLTSSSQLPGVIITDSDGSTTTVKLYDQNGLDDPSDTSSERYVRVDNITSPAQVASAFKVALKYVPEFGSSVNDGPGFNEVQITSSATVHTITNENLAFINGGIRETTVINSSDSNTNRIASNGSLAWAAGGSGTAGTAEIEFNDPETHLQVISEQDSSFIGLTKLPTLTVTDQDGDSIQIRFYRSVGHSGAGLFVASPGSDSSSIVYVDYTDGGSGYKTADQLRDAVVSEVNAVKSSDLGVTFAASSDTGKMTLTLPAGAKGSAAVVGTNCFSGGNSPAGTSNAGSACPKNAASISSSPFDNAAAGTGQTLTMDFVAGSSTLAVLNRVTSVSNLPSVAITDGSGTGTVTFRFYSTTGISSPSDTTSIKHVAVSATPGTTAANFKTAVDASSLSVSTAISTAQVIITDTDSGTSTNVTTTNGVNDTTIPFTTWLADSDPGWEVGQVASTDFAANLTKESTGTRQNSHGFLPYVPPFLDPNTRPYVELSVTPTTTANYEIPQILDMMTEEYYNIEQPSNYKDANNTNYNEAMALSASINFRRYVKLNSDNFRTTDNGTIIPDSNVDKKRWVIQPRWETPILNFKDAKVKAVKMPSGDIGTVTNSPWKTRYQTDYYKELRSSTTSYLTSSTGIWHQRGEIIEDNDDAGYHLAIVGDTHDLSKQKGDLARMCGFTDFDQDRKESTRTYVSTKLGRLAEKRRISEAVVAIPYWLTKDCQMRLFVLEEESYNQAVQINAMKDAEKAEALLNASSDEERNYVNGMYEMFSESPGQTAETNIAYQLRMMQKYVFPPQFDFLKNDDVANHVQYIFQFKSELTKQDLADIWQNLYPTSNTGCSVAQHSEISVNPIKSDVEYISGFLNTQNIPVLDKRKSNYSNPQEFLDKEVRWLVFKVKYRSEFYYNNVVEKSVSEAGANITEWNGRRRDSRGMKPQTEIRQLEKFSYNWPYDYFSLVELIKLDSKVDFYSNVDMEPVLNMMGNISLGSQATNIQRLVPDLSAGALTDTTSTSQTTSELIATNMVTQEVLSAIGSTPSNARVFTAATAIVRSGTQNVYVNGILQSEGNDYAINGNQLTFNYDIEASDSLTLGYVKQN